MIDARRERDVADALVPIDSNSEIRLLLQLADHRLDHHVHPALLRDVTRTATNSVHRLRGLEGDRVDRLDVHDAELELLARHLRRIDGLFLVHGANCITDLVVLSTGKMKKVLV